MGRERTITVTLVIDDITDTDPENETGITTNAYERLADAVIGAGFSVKEIARDY